MLVKRGGGRPLSFPRRRESTARTTAQVSMLGNLCSSALPLRRRSWHDKRHWGPWRFAFCRICGVPVLIFCISRLILVLYLCKLCVCYCTGIWSGAATCQLCFSQGADTRYAIFCVFVADACAFVTSLYPVHIREHCRIPRWRVPLDLGPGVRQDAGGEPMWRIGGKGGRGQRADVMGNGSVWWAFDHSALGGSPALERTLDKRPDCRPVRVVYGTNLHVAQLGARPF